MSASTFWSPNDDRMLDIWIEHGYPESNDVSHLLDVTVRARNIMRHWQGITAELVEVPRDLIAGEIAAHLAFQGLTESDAETLRVVAATVRKVLTGAEPATPAPECEQLTLDTSGDSLADAVAAYAGVSPELVQVIPNREGTPSDQTGGAL